MNKIIFGGAFDPVHNGHINMAEKASKALDGEVIFVPARISIWKTSSAPIVDKIAMLKLAIKDNPAFSIDEFEINSGREANYSIDTVKYFVQKYPKDKIFYLIGSDQVNQFHRWKDAEELSKLVQIVFYKRPGSEVDSENVKRFNMRIIEGNIKDIASADIREFKAFDVPDEVLFYIVDTELYAGVRALHALMSEHRWAHSKSVAKLAYEIAKSNKVKNPIEYYISGLLHDVGKDLPIEEQKALTKKHFPEYQKCPEFAYHQFAGAALAKTVFKIDKKDMLEAIEFHSTGNEKMSMLAKTIYASDKIEPTRGFDSTDLINAMMKNIDDGFVKVLSANKVFLLSKGKKVDNFLTSKCFKYYL